MQNQPSGRKKVLAKLAAWRRPPVVINAILNALHPLGIRHIDMPATSERIWQVMRFNIRETKQ